jgi:hypothetical protein
MPGFMSHGAAGSKMKGDGSDLFITSCGLLAAGSRSVLLSRWRVGGKNSLELTRAFASRLQTLDPPAAWKESLELARKLDIEVELEPRVKPEKSDQPLKADHPFFWAGHMVIAVSNDGQTDDDPPNLVPNGAQPKPADDAGGDANADEAGNIDAGNDAPKDDDGAGGDPGRGDAGSKDDGAGGDHDRIRSLGSINN